MRKHTTSDQRREFYAAHQRGETYQEIAGRYSVSQECVRYWCRRQRDGGSCETVYHKEPTGILSGFDPLVRYCILRLRLGHPRWGPSRIARTGSRARAQPAGFAVGSAGFAGVAIFSGIAGAGWTAPVTAALIGGA